MIDILAVVNNKSDYNRIMNAQLKVEPYVTILNELKDKKKAWQIKEEYGAKEVPFIILNKDCKLLRVFYKEEYPDPILEMINYINSNESICSDTRVANS